MKVSVTRNNAAGGGSENVYFFDPMRWDEINARLAELMAAPTPQAGAAGTAREEG